MVYDGSSALYQRAIVGFSGPQQIALNCVLNFSYPDTMIVFFSIKTCILRREAQNSGRITST
jgi:hypothetical protein